MKTEHVMTGKNSFGRGLVAAHFQDDGSPALRYVGENTYYGDAASYITDQVVATCYRVNGSAFVMPCGVLHSEADAQLLEAIAANCDAEIAGIFGNGVSHSEEALAALQRAGHISR